MPTVSEVLDLLKDAVYNPPDKGKQRRPGKVVFTSSSLYHGCKTTVKEVEIEPCWVENSADGLEEYVKEISRKMVLDGRADRDETTADMKSMDASFDKKDVGIFYGIYGEVLGRKPWGDMNERQSFRVEGAGVGGAPVWVVVVGGGGGDLHGVAILRNRMDLERRYGERRGSEEQIDGRSEATSKGARENTP